MTRLQIGIAVVLADLLAVTAWAVSREGVAAFYQFPWLSPVALQVSADLVIALGLVVVWMWRDARARGVSPLPYVAVTLVAGSFGPLLYLFTRAADHAAQPAALVRARTA